jgi:hypothetical protein
VQAALSIDEHKMPRQRARARACGVGNAGLAWLRRSLDPQAESVPRSSRRAG